MNSQNLACIRSAGALACALLVKPAEFAHDLRPHSAAPSDRTVLSNKKK